MALSNHAFEDSNTPPEATSSALFQCQPEFNSNDIQALIHDFFVWFEEEWKQPVIHTSWPNREELLGQRPSPSRLDEDRLYSKEDLASLVKRSPNKIIESLKKAGIRPANKQSRRHVGARGSSYAYLFLGRECSEFVEKWNRETLCAALDNLWARFVPEPCGKCPRCLKLKRISRFECSFTHSHAIRDYRESFNRFIRTLQRYENIGCWWQHEQNSIIARSPASMALHTGIVLLYLLDRHLLDLSFDHLLALPFPDIKYEDFLRPWSHRHPEEYQSYLLSLEPLSGEEARRSAHAILSFIFMKYGTKAITELGRRLPPEEIRLLAHEQRLLTPHLCYDVFLDVPLSDDIRAGHVALDELRFYFWSYAWNRI